MPEQERKWRAYKVAVIPVEFTSSIIPVFVSKDKVTGTEYKHTDDKGTWRLTSSKEGNYGLYSVCDKSTSSSWWIYECSDYVWAILELPDGMLIAPSRVKMCGYGVNENSYMEGYDPTTGEWKFISNIGGNYANVKREYAVAEENQIYCSKFRFNLKSATQYGSLKKTDVSELDILTGKYKIV
jgi:hypothetical protein